MQVWKNGRNAPYMYGTDRLTPEQVQQAVDNMSYTGLQTAAASFLVLARTLGMTPAEMMCILEADTEKCPVRFEQPELSLEGGSGTVPQKRQQYDD